MSRNARLQAWRNALVGARRTDSIGSLDGELEEAFGTIVDLDISRGRVAVLDQSLMRVFILDHSLQVRGIVGRQGSGPSEFQAPIGVSLSGDTLRVYDAALGHKVFDIAGLPHMTARLISSFLPVVPVQSACFRAGAVYAIAPSSLQPGRESSREVEPLVTVLGPDGRIRSSFGESYSSPSPLVRRMMSEGVIGCDDRGRALVGLAKLPFVTLYSPDGLPQRRVRFRDFEVSSSLERPNSRGQMSIGLDPATEQMSSLSRIVHIDGDVFAVQVSRFRLTRDRRSFPEVTVETFLVDVSTFDAVAVGSHLPRIGRADTSHLVTFANDPFPRVIRFRLDVRSGPAGEASR